MNKSQGEIIKYKQAYESQRERRKEMECKLTQTADEIQREAKKNFLEHEELNRKMNEPEILKDHLLKQGRFKHLTDKDIEIISLDRDKRWHRMLKKWN